MGPALKDPSANEPDVSISYRTVAPRRVLGMHAHDTVEPPPCDHHGKVPIFAKLGIDQPARPELGFLEDAHRPFVVQEPRVPRSFKGHGSTQINHFLGKSHSPVLKKKSSGELL